MASRYATFKTHIIDSKNANFFPSAQTHDLKNALAGQIARALAVFCIDEIIIFDDGQGIPRSDTRLHHLNDRQRQVAQEAEANGYTAFSDPGQFLYHILSYLETPPQFRKVLFPFHPNLRTAGSLPSLDMPHHLKADEWCQYREGVTMQSHIGAGGREETSINTGLAQQVSVPVVIPANTRVTLDFEDNDDDVIGVNQGPLTANPVDPATPREEGGYYWGYTVRNASSLEAVFTEPPFEGGYDYCIGTSERGIPVQDLTNADTQRPKWSHLLICFGGVAGLEKAFENDTSLQSKGLTKVEDLFDVWINFVQGQGSRTIRTEEALWIGLSSLMPFVRQSHV